jgi:hypothetical protein
MPNQRGDDRVKLQAWVLAELQQQLKEQAIKEGLSQVDLLNKAITTYLQHNAKGARTNKGLSGDADNTGSDSRGQS